MQSISPQPDISFVMPCYKDGKTLEVAVNSLLDQDWHNIEVIIVNDGSPDNANDIIDKLEAKDARVKSVRYEQNMGACQARNAGALLAKGRYLSFLPADAFLYPGNIRVWVEALDANPDYAFLYGGYRFVKELSPYGGEVIPGTDYMFEPFDPYTLSVTNYIDGSFPLRKEWFDKIGGWDPSVKSLQDWDFWIRVVNAGGKGLYLRDIFFETELPHQGGLSFDSAANWLERTNYIKTKNNLPIRKTCVASIGAGWHARHIAKVLDADFKEMPSFKPHEYEAIYAVGFYPQFGDVQDQIFLNNCNDKNQGRTPAKKIVHLVGTDIYQLQGASKLVVDFYRNYFQNNIDVLLVEDKFTQDEMKELKIPSQIVPIPPHKLYKVQPLPEKFQVACYMPEINKAFYRPELMLEVAKALPDVSFKFFGDQYQRGVFDNVEYLGYLTEPEMDALIANSSALMRLPIHDGLSLNSIEFITAGRHVISSTPVKHAIHTKPELLDIVEAIKKAQTLGVNTIGSKYWTKRCDPKTYRKTMLKLFEYQPKEYWENRALSWDVQAGTALPDIQTLEPILMDLKPNTVLDIGCGSGRFYPYFEKQNVVYRGIDISSKLVSLAQRKYPNGMFKSCKVEDIPKPAEKFDLGFSYTCLEHITEEDFPKAVKALKNSCKKLLLIEPVNFKTRHYCHDHNYNKHFNVIKEVKLSDKIIFLIDNEV